MSKTKFKLEPEEGHCAMAFVQRIHYRLKLSFDKPLTIKQIIDMLAIPEAEKQKLMDECNNGYPYGMPNNERAWLGYRH